jgi:methyl-accepting chemotaxis protein
MPLLPKFKIADKLPLILVGSALLVGLGIGVAAYSIGLQTVEQQRQQSFEASVQSAADQAADYLKNVQIDLVQHADWPDTFTQIDNMMQIWNQQKLSNLDPQKSLQFTYITAVGTHPRRLGGGDGWPVRRPAQAVPPGVADGAGAARL